MNDVDEWSSWMATGGCSKSCGSGFIKYIRSCDQSQSDGRARSIMALQGWSSSCDGESEKTEACNTQACRKLYFYVYVAD